MVFLALRLLTKSTALVRAFPWVVTQIREQLKVPAVAVQIPWGAEEDLKE